MSDNQNIDTTTNINETDTNKTSTDHSDDYEKICYVCRRPESKAGEMITMPGGMNFCHECMQKAFDSISKSEGDMTKTRASLVCEPTLAFCAQEIDLGGFLLLGKGEDATGGRGRDSVVSDAMEALIGAIYLDGGFANAKEFIHRFILNDMEHKKLFYDSKTILQEIVQGHTDETLTYVLLKEEGPDHNKSFEVSAMLDGQEIGRGIGRTKKSAEQRAAYRGILTIRKPQE